MPSVLSIDDARKRFGSTLALDDTGFTLERGEWLALLGPNGAGKTTLVRAVAGRVRLDGGRITLLDQTLDGTPAAGQARTRLGVVPQEIALYPLLTAVENLRAFGALNGLAGRALTDRVTWALEWTGLADRAREPVKRFSGGMKRRLNIACGVLHEPEVILLDEPTVGVDPQSRQRIWEMLEDVRRAGASLLLTTHQLDEAQQVCDRIVIIDHGQAIAAGTFDELVAQTIGSGRRVRFGLATPLTNGAGGGAGGGAPSGLEGFEIEDDGTLACRVDDLARELPARLAAIAAANGRVVDVRIDEPTLQAVFIHLTGHELRE